jgi:hypothetical protein
MNRQRKNPEDEKELSPVTRVILKDLKGLREIKQGTRNKNRFQKEYTPKKQEENTDTSHWMPKNVPKEMKRLIKETERKTPVGVKNIPKKKKVSVQKQREKFEYTVQLKTGKKIKSRKIIIKGSNVVMITEEMKIEIPASSVKWIKESRVRIITL